MYCVTTTVTKLQTSEQNWEWGIAVSLGSVLGVAVQCVSPVVSLSNEVPWSCGSRPSLGPHTSLMFSHHSPDNYWGRECHLSRASSTEDDSTRSVVCQTCYECVACRTHSSHSHMPWASPNTRKRAAITQSEPYVSSQHMGCLTPSALLQQIFSSLTQRSIYVSKQQACNDNIRSNSLYSEITIIKTWPIRERDQW